MPTRRAWLAFTVALACQGWGCGALSTPVEPAAVASPPVPRPSHALAAPIPVAKAAPDDAQPADDEAPAPEVVAEPPSEQPTFEHAVVPREDTRAIVLMYHTIHPGFHTDRAVYPHTLDSHLHQLRADGIEVIRLSQLIAFLHGEILLPRHVAVITIDDSESNAFTHAFPVLERHRAPFALGVITSGVEGASYGFALSWDQIRQMQASGLCEVASHGHTHKGLAKLPLSAVRDELQRSADLIERALGAPPTAFIYPLGSVNDQAATEAGELYRAAFTAVGNTVDHETPRFRVPRWNVTRKTSLNAFKLWLRWGKHAHDAVAAR